MLINQRIINLERNQEQYFLSQSTNSHLMMSDELMYMEDCVLGCRTFTLIFQMLFKVQMFTCLLILKNSGSSRNLESF